VVEPLSRPLRIGMIAPAWLAVPPTGYGGTEALIDALCRGLSTAGHDVHLFASGDSTCPVTLHSVSERALGVDVGGVAVEIDHVVAAYREFDRFDIIHDHTTAGPFVGRSMTATPIVTTNHNRFARPFSTGFAEIASDVPVVAISHHHAATAGDIPLGAVILHGINPADFPVGSGSGGYALFLGRMIEAKGAHRAIHAAVAAGISIFIAGKAVAPDEIAYVEEQIRPFLGSSVHYLGEIETAAKLELLAGASCLLNPIAWDEPFGMVMIEALACGTPVIALRSGAAPEIVEDGVTGLLVDHEAELVAALEAVSTIDRSACRAAVEGYFSVDRMVAEHVAFYTEVIAAHGRGGGST
jgi:glycosyltransferase involved in cell wall biosynthesis